MDVCTELYGYRNRRGKDGIEYRMQITYQRRADYPLQYRGL